MPLTASWTPVCVFSPFPPPRCIALQWWWFLQEMRNSAGRSWKGRIRHRAVIAGLRRFSFWFLGARQLRETRLRLWLTQVLLFLLLWTFLHLSHAVKGFFFPPWLRLRGLWCDLWAVVFLWHFEQNHSIILCFSNPEGKGGSITPIRVKLNQVWTGSWLSAAECIFGCSFCRGSWCAQFYRDVGKWA